MTHIRKILTTPLRIAISLVLMGMLLQILEWPYASVITIASFLTIAILYPIRFFKKPGKQFLDYVKIILVVFWSLNGIFRVLDFAYTLFFQVIIAVSFLLWVILEGTAYFLDEDRKAKNSRSQMWWNITMVVGTLAIIAGSLLNLLGWPFAIPLMVVGVVGIVAFILKDVIVPARLKNEDASNEEYQL